RRRRGGGSAHQLREHPRAAQHRRGAIAVRRAEQHGALAEQAEAARIVELDAAELRTEHAVDAVMPRESLVQERVLRGQQLEHAAILEEHALEEQLDLGLESASQRWIEHRKQVSIR